jgi:hypothetical protein
MPRVRRLYGILDCGLPKNDKMLQISPDARWLYVVLLLDCKLLDNGGRFTVRQALASGDAQVEDVEGELSELVRVGLLTRDRDELTIPSWSNWNESSDERAKKLEADRARKRNSKGQSEGSA